MCAAKDRIYLFGGSVNDKATSVAFSYNPASQAWEKLADMPTARTASFACVSSDGLIYVIGGMANSMPLNCVEVYDADSGTWIKKSGMIVKRWDAGCGYSDGKIYVF
ncbi:kelch-like protein diablo, partial [Paramacrobiotus metropolitanus]|uniref:kelch-like protein diablo n=1 Tax=Paramacrobiotus metropolitanus TaxID=2943436 RepID=UPI002445EA94